MTPTQLAKVALTSKRIGVLEIKKVQTHKPTPTRRQRVERKSRGARTVNLKNIQEQWSVIRSGTVNRPAIEQHLLVQHGLATTFLQAVVESYSVLSEDEVLRAIGISVRTIQRRKEGKLNKEHSGATLNLIEITEMATQVLGNREAAESWLHEPALALDGRAPMELLSTGPGAELVKAHLTRMEYGVYA
jgi:putative toxin-antitoxin system antitoxin component (TIGR02293 family)